MSNPNETPASVAGSFSPPNEPCTTVIVCAYMGPPDECAECGGFDETGTGFCSHDCRAARADREERQAAEAQARRDRVDAFAAEVERLRGLGYSYEECDVLLAGIPT